ncbi:MAG: hypothetical protein KF796_19175 [Ramlibacter sp.]|nr:hypothetical protein [Ramlibacter sp.]
MKYSMGYRFGGTPGLCVGCAHHVKQHDGLRCQIGGFWVQAGAGCKEFAPEASGATDTTTGNEPIPENLIQIGPTDV